MSELSKSKLLVLFCLFFIIGVATGFYLPETDKSISFYLFCLLVASLVVVVIVWRRKKFRYAGLMAAFFILGMWRFTVFVHFPTATDIDYYNGQKVSVQGVVANEPIRKANYQKFELAISRRLTQKDSQVINGKILVFSNRFPELEYGDRLELFGELNAPENFSDFDYGRYLSQFDIYSVSYYPSLKKLPGNQGSRVYDFILSVKNKMKDLINNGLEEPGSSIIVATLLGDSSGISDEWKKLFSYTGISHVIAISGMHITLLIIILAEIMLALGVKRKNVFYITIVVLSFYVVLIGMLASAVRAAIMGFIVLLATQSGRVGKISNALFLAAAVLLFCNPRSLRSDIGFQLSFLAVLAIIYIYPHLNDWASRKKFPRLWGVRDIVLITIATQILTVPIIQNNFKIVSFVSPLANVFIIPISTLILLASIAAVFLSIILPYFSVAFFLPVKLTIDYMLFVVEKCNNLPFAYKEFDYNGTAWLIIYYLVIAYLVYRKNSR